jgi:hypothetical protein
MFVLAIPVLSALVLAIFVLLVFIAIVIGLHQAHPRDLALQRPTCLAALARRVVGLHVRRDRIVLQVADREVSAR